MNKPTTLDLNALQIFAAVAEAGGFTAAALRLGMTKGQLSLQVRRLEARLGTALFTRTTRQVALTAAGQSLFEECGPLLDRLREAVDRIAAGEAELAGLLRISTSVDHAAQSLAPAVARFVAQHPGVQVEIRSSDKVVDMVKEGIDLSIRLGWLRDSSQRALYLRAFDQYIVAAPAYLRRKGMPMQPMDLAEHEWIALTLLPTPLTWTLEQRGGEPETVQETVQVSARLKVDSPAALRALLVEGAGISVLDESSAMPELAAGRLQRVLEGWQLKRGGIHAVLPPGRHVPARVRAFIEFYRNWLGAAG
ncbi:LysR family transcriptional regulator [Azoarcus indigens]|uniref:LysR family transcriptional regulator n=1 Tax=Azoarcus indigens TaxID=29545 RepID=A0A4R6E651_9RHOO|nr:LysR family transcriptional regulator [Azoarcus indigens]NMG65413.1 LysR family transcriptional regulator [Azoarcus indigens]TDN53385.1 LysR family transcriptional regulator [Azoarcus indigens]